MLHVPQTQQIYKYEWIFNILFMTIVWTTKFNFVAWQPFSHSMWFGCFYFMWSVMGSYNLVWLGMGLISWSWGLDPCNFMFNVIACLEAVWSVMMGWIFCVMWTEPVRGWCGQDPENLAWCGLKPLNVVWCGHQTPLCQALEAPILIRPVPFKRLGRGWDNCFSDKKQTKIKQ